MATELLNAQGQKQETSVPTYSVATVINVKDFGAKGDGTTDDHNSIQAAINAAGAGGGRGWDLYFPAGVYVNSSTLICNFSNVMLRGSGWQSTVLYNNFATTDILRFGNGTGSPGGCGIERMSIWGSGSRTSGATININLMNDFLLRNFVINNCFQGILVQGASIKVWIDQGEINNTLATTGVGIQVTNGLAGDTYMTDIIFSNSPGSKPAAGIQLTQSGHCEITRCNITSCAKGIHINPGANQDVSYVFIDSSMADSGGTHGLHINPAGAATARVRSINAVNSWFSGSALAGGGIEFTTAGGAIIDGITFIGCRILNNYQHGVIINAGANNIIFNTCLIAGNGQNVSNTYDGISIGANVSNINIINNRIGPTGTATNTQRYAVVIAAGTSGGITITGNDFLGNGTVGTGSYMNIGGLTGVNNNIANNKPQNRNSASWNMPAPVATSGTTETLIFKAKIPANSITIGDMFLFDTIGISSSTGTLIFRIKVGANGTTADTQAWISITSAAQAANWRSGFRGMLTIRSLTSVQVEAQGWNQTATTPFHIGLNTVIAAVATAAIVSTADWYIDITCTCSAGAWTAQHAIIKPV